MSVGLKGPGLLVTVVTGPRRKATDAAGSARHLGCGSQRDERFAERVGRDQLHH